MRFSSLQQFILTECYNRKGRTRKKLLLSFYDKQKKKPSVKDQVDAMTKSIESLTVRGFLIEYGARTSKKWYIEEVRLTPKGRRVTRAMIQKRQQQLPLKK